MMMIRMAEVPYPCQMASSWAPPRLLRIKIEACERRIRMPETARGLSEMQIIAAGSTRRIWPCSLA